MLGPTLFTLFTDDLPSSIKSGDTFMYADDTTVFCIGSSHDVACNLLNCALEELFTWCVNNRLTPHPGKCEVMLLSKARLIGPLPAIYIGKSIIEFKATARLLGVTLDQNLSWIPHLKEVIKNFANKLSLLKKSKFLPSHVCESFYFKVILPSITYAMPVWGGVNQTELFKTLERQHCRAARIIFGFPLDMPTVDVLATVKWNTLTYMYKRSLVKLFFEGYHGMLPCTLAEELIIHGDRPSSRLKHGLIAPSFASKYVQNSISYRGAVLWNAIGRSNGSILECTDMKSFLKNVVKYHTFKYFNFNVLAPQIIDKRSENFIYF